MLIKSYRSAASELTRRENELAFRMVSTHELPFRMDRLRQAHEDKKISCDVAIRAQPFAAGGRMINIGFHVYGEKAAHVAGTLYQGAKVGITDASYTANQSHIFDYRRSGLSGELLGRLIHASRYIGGEYFMTGAVEHDTAPVFMKMGFALIKSNNTSDIPDLIEQGWSLQQVREKRGIADMGEVLYGGHSGSIVALADYSTPAARYDLYGKLGLPQPG